MRLNLYTFLKPSVCVAGALAILVSCNKKLPEAQPILTAPASSSIIDALNDPNFSILKAAVTRAGTNLTALLSDKSGVFTFFAPTDAAFGTIGITSPAALAAFRPGQLDTILRYALIGGQKLTSSAIPGSFPNLQEPSSLVLAPPSAALPPGLRMPLFPSKQGTAVWVNTVPVTQTDIQAGNSVIHKTASVLLPPTTTIKGIIASDPSKFSILSAAIARADSGQVAGLGRLDSVINYAPANLTLFAPTNDAFRALFPPGTPDVAIIALLNDPAFFTAQTVRAMIAYHLLGVRAFSVNFSATPTPVNTQLVIPGPTPTVVPVIVTNTGTSFTVKGLANPTPSNVTTKDKNAINGVVHEIDQVLKPQ